MAIVREAEQATAWNATTSPRTLTGLSWSSGDVIIVRSGSEGSSDKLNAPTNANLTFTLQASQESTGAPCYIYSAVAGSTQSSQTISMTRLSGTGRWGFHYGRYSGCSGSFANATQTNNNNASINPSADSAICWHTSDWNADSGNQTAETGSGTVTELYDDRQAGKWSWYGADWLGVSTGADNYGATDASSGGWDPYSVALEILASTSADAAPNLTAIAAVTTMTAPAAQASSSRTTTAITAPATMTAAVGAASAAPTLTSIVATTTITAPVPNAGSSVTTTSIVAPATLTAAAPNASSTVTTTSIPAPTTMTAAVANASSTRTTSAIVAPATLTAAAPNAGSSVTTTSIPAPATLTAAVPQTAGDAQVNLTSIVATTTMTAAAATGSVAPTLTAIAATTTMTAPVPNAGSSVTTTSIPAPATLTAPAVNASSSVTTTSIPAPATLTAAVPQTSGDAQVNLTSIAATTTMTVPKVMRIPDYSGNPDVGLITSVGSLTDHAGGTFDTGTTTLTQRRITGRIDVRDGANLILRDCLFDMSNASSFVLTQWDDTQAASGYMLIEDCTFGTGTNDQGDHISMETTATSVPNEPARYNGFGIIIRRSIFQRGRDGMQGGKNVYIEECRTVAADAITTPDYGDGFQSLGGSHIKFSYCNLHVEPVPEGYAGIILKTDLGNIDDVVVDNCRINGGAFNIDLDNDGGSGTVTNVVFTNNRMTGADTAVANNADGILTWTNNTDANGDLIPQPGPAATATLTAITAPATLTAPAVNASSSVTLTSIAATTNLTAAVPQTAGNAIVNLTAIAATTTMTAPVANASSSRTTTAIAAVTTLTAPVPQTAGNAQANATAIAATTTLTAAAVNAGSAVTTTAITAPATLTAAAAQASSSRTTTSIAATTTLTATGQQLGTSTTLTAITATATIPTPAIAADAIITLTAIAAATTMTPATFVVILARGWIPPYPTQTVIGELATDREVLPVSSTIGTLDP